MHLLMCALSVKNSNQSINQSIKSINRLIKKNRMVVNGWLVGLGVWFSLRVREVPGSNPNGNLIIFMVRKQVTKYEKNLFKLSTGVFYS